MRNLLDSEKLPIDVIKICPFFPLRFIVAVRVCCISFVMISKEVYITLAMGNLEDKIIIQNGHNRFFCLYFLKEIF